MTTRESLQDVKARLAARWRDVVTNACPNRKIIFRGNSARIGNKGSLYVTPEYFHDHETNEGGDLIKFIQCQLNCSFKEALKWSEDYGFASGNLSSAPPPQNVKKESDDASIQKRIAKARDAWNKCDVEPCDVVRSYLKHRNIEEGSYAC